MEERYLDKLRRLSDEYAHTVYKLSKKLPKEERYGLTSQLTRSALSVSLNVIEGYARKSEKDFLRFIDIAFGSLKESKYLLEFCMEEKLLTAQDGEPSLSLADSIGGMLWGVLKNHSMDS